MTSSLPIDPLTARSLTGVLPQLIASVSGRPDWFPSARSAVVIVADGLGRGNLSQRSAYARFLTERMTKRDSARTVFPATTAAALTSLFTGVTPGEHGIVGYRVRVPGTSAAPNQLTGWEHDGLDPHTWQRSRPLFEREAAAGRPCFVVSRAQYAGTGFTTATVRGAEFVAASGIAERLASAEALAAAHEGALVYAYIPELDVIGHGQGWESDRWAAELESLDAELRRWDRQLGPGIGAVLTADHGMVDVPAHRHVLLDEGDPLLDEVEIVAGEPRMLHLYASDGAGARVASRWRASESDRSWVMTRAEAIGAGLFGAVHPEVEERIGDVLVAARSGVAYYDDRSADKKPQRMIGQHGSLTDQERIVPLVRLGAFA
ncbi:alkaline phosphatase family protein [Microbacterium sp. cf332]|uniref:alkaline phosphatase family protein n=1 Tax=Microbacterium sp. cf332 TaxID=1761804 RepID=UPI00088B2126|nr:nucleotide pyrophosphatase/phosphodiesterase family protein [Microbacterium sp. cf332]SDQ15889.1 Type I phosphodiesterase / nucleotide pyrophosphatase [Microbacterium sp. cf332]